MVEFFKGLSFLILPLGFGSKRVEFFEKQIRKFGGTLGESGERVSHVVIEDSVSSDKESFLSALKSYGIEAKKNVKCVSVKWLSKCLSSKSLVEEKPFEVEWLKGVTELPLKEEKNVVENRKEKARENDEDESPEKKQKMNAESYICSKPSTSAQGNFSQTKKTIIEELEKLADAYSTRNDIWRSYSYRKAISAIMLHDKEIYTFQEARKIPGIGDKMALKIMEIIESGKLEKVDEVLDDKTKILNSFCKVWGAGPVAAESWYAQGFRTLEDLKTNAKLTRQQQIGLKLYEDLQKRIPRQEVMEIGEIVKREVLKLQSSLSVELVGSFRRGKETCGDVDLMIVNAGGRTSLEILLSVTEALKAQGYLTDDLVNLQDLSDSDEGNNHRKYFGVFKLLGENQTHRRIDLFIVPKSEYASALVHYTGSALFNRSIKLLAAKKQMTLTEHGLYVDSIRKGSEVTNKGQLVTTLSEEDIFKKLGLPYRHPEERDH